jgi:hypothetical protein
MRRRRRRRRIRGKRWRRQRRLNHQRKKVRVTKQVMPLIPLLMIPSQGVSSLGVVWDTSLDINPSARGRNGKAVDKGKVVEKAKDVVKGKKADVTKAVKRTQIDETTVYLEDVQKPRYSPALQMVVIFDLIVCVQFCS